MKAIDEGIMDILRKIIGRSDLDDVRQFMKEHGAKNKHLVDLESMAAWIYHAQPGVKEEFLGAYNEYDDPPLRICSHCGDFMNEGYMLDYEYACSDECAIALYGGDEAQLREDIRQSVEEEICGDFFWTQWF
jgi:hypothetical protein